MPETYVSICLAEKTMMIPHPGVYAEKVTVRTIRPSLGRGTDKANQLSFEESVATEKKKKKSIGVWGW